MLDMTDKEYEVFERFAIIADDEGDLVALAMIRQQYGARWVEWIKDKVYAITYKGGKDD